MNEMKDNNIKYTYSGNPEDGFFITSEISADNKRYKLEYIITANLAAEFSYAKNPDFDLLKKAGKSELAARSVFNAARSINLRYGIDCLKGRTVKGIRNELLWHYRFYKRGILKSRAEPADIGSVDKENPGYDNNAWIFEFFKFLK
jgi:hypothetical protein